MKQPTARQDAERRREHIAARLMAVATLEYPAIALHALDAPDREVLEARIADRFAQQYGARIRHFLPYLVDLSVAGELGAVAGLRPAREGGLFLEQYLDVPVEQAVSRAYKTPVARDQVVEIGNLVSAAPGAASLLFGLLPALLTRSGFRWVACTATPQVRSMLCKLGFTTRTICDADPEVLGDGQQDWGNYYDSRPQVIVGDIRKALIRAAGNGDLCSLMQHQRMPIEDIATALRRSG